MFDFGDEVIVGNYRIPWLIWIQLLVMFLLIMLLYSFSLYALDFPHTTSRPSSSGDSHLHKSTTATAVTTCFPSIKVGGCQSIKGEIAASTSKTIVRGEDMMEREGSARKDVTHISFSENCFHPCYYIRLAREAFLKCLGLDSISDNSSSSREQSKED